MRPTILYTFLHQTGHDRYLATTTHGIWPLYDFYGILPLAQTSLSIEPMSFGTREDAEHSRSRTVLLELKILPHHSTTPKHRISSITHQYATTDHHDECIY
jgi:hypothetical protein